MAVILAAWPLAQLLWLLLLAWLAARYILGPALHRARRGAE
jgi:hypothetical protein